MVHDCIWLGGKWKPYNVMNTVLIYRKIKRFKKSEGHDSCFHSIFSDVSERLIEQCFYTQSRADLVVRTSGEVRLSDFLLYQVNKLYLNRHCNTKIHDCTQCHVLLQSSFSVLWFVNSLWPDFRVWHFYAAIINYQYNCKVVEVRTALYETMHVPFLLIRCNDND